MSQSGHRNSDGKESDHPFVAFRQRISELIKTPHRLISERPGASTEPIRVVVFQSEAGDNVGRIEAQKSRIAQVFRVRRGDLSGPLGLVDLIVALIVAYVIVISQFLFGHPPLVERAASARGVSE